MCYTKKNEYNTEEHRLFGGKRMGNTWNVRICGLQIREERRE